MPMRRSNGPTAKVIAFAASQPGGIISWSEAQGAYGCGVVVDYKGDLVRAASQHKMSVSNVLQRHFERVEGARGMYVLRSTIGNPDWDEDMAELEAHRDMFGSDEFGMSILSAGQALAHAIDSIGSSVVAGAGYGFQRMSDISSDWSGASVSIVGGDFDGASGRIT